MNKPFQTHESVDVRGGRILCGIKRRMIGNMCVMIELYVLAFIDDKDERKRIM